MLCGSLRAGSSTRKNSILELEPHPTTTIETFRRRMVTGWGDWMAIFNQVHWSAPLGILNIMRNHGIKEGHRPGSLPVGWMTCVCNKASFWSDLGYFGMTLPILLFWSKALRMSQMQTTQHQKRIVYGVWGCFLGSSLVLYSLMSRNIWNTGIMAGPQSLSG